MPGPSHQPLIPLFLRFLRFGLLAWGGPVAQIAMIREELVERERWISPERFNRVLSVYQALPGPEAHELCVYFGYLARGRLGGLLAGLGFMLPGFSFMLVLAWLYVRFELRTMVPDGLFYGFQAAVLALIVRGLYGIGRHALTNPWLFGIAMATLGAELAGVHFGITLAAAGVAFASARRERIMIVLAAAIGVAIAGIFLPTARGIETTDPALHTLAPTPSVLTLFGAGLLTGLLTFGGAYSAIPFMRQQAVGAGGWITHSQFVDSLALTGILPAPLVIFGTFIGYLGAGFPGALAVTAGIFLPAFGFTLIGFAQVERLVQEPRLHAFLDGVTAGVVGLIAATAMRLAPTSAPDVPAVVISALALGTLLVWRWKAAIAVVVLAAGALGMLVACF